MSIKDNVTVALFVSRRLHGAHRVKTNLDKLIISYARTIKVKLRLAKLGNGLALNRGRYRCYKHWAEVPHLRWKLYGVRLDRAHEVRVKAGELTQRPNPANGITKYL